MNKEKLIARFKHQLSKCPLIKEGNQPTNKQTLITAMHEKVNYTEESDQVLYIKDVIDIINNHMEGMMLVSVDLIRDIDGLTEAGFGAENEIDALCELIKAHQESSE